MSCLLDSEPVAVLPLPEAPPDNPFAGFCLQPRPRPDPFLRGLAVCLTSLVALVPLALTWASFQITLQNDAELQVVAGVLERPVPPPPDSTATLPERELRGWGDDLLVIQRLDRRPEAELRRELETVPEMSFERGTRAFRIQQERRFDLVGLAVNDADCRLDPESAKRLEAMAVRMRGYLSTTRQVVDKEANMRYLLENDPLFHTPEAVTCLMQMLQPECRPVRQALVAQLKRVEGNRSSEALARLAVFDLSGEVRTEAIVALSARNPSQCRDVLLAALRHPWPAAANHAAETLVALHDTGALPDLQNLADRGDPAALPTDSEFPQVRELIRLNHLKNCTFCHIDSKKIDEPLRGFVPSPGQPLPPLLEYYHNPSGPFVRADVTFLRQDFSAALPVANAAPWPNQQRFDFLVRTRHTLPGEPASQPASPQWLAVQFALRQLGGNTPSE